MGSDPRELLESQRDRLMPEMHTLMDDDTADGGVVADLTGRWATALRDVLDLCDKADNGVLAPYFRAIETVYLRNAITTALEAS